MNKYGQVAVLAATILRQGSSFDPPQAWKSAVSEVFPDSLSCQQKACPKGAFLGLCEAGIVKGVQPGSYTRSVDNKKYAVEAVAVLQNNPKLANDRGALWKRVMKGIKKKENSQMDVVVALWNEELIVR